MLTYLFRSLVSLFASVFVCFVCRLGDLLVSSLLCRLLRFGVAVVVVVVMPMAVAVVFLVLAMVVILVVFVLILVQPLQFFRPIRPILSDPYRDRQTSDLRSSNPLSALARHSYAAQMGHEHKLVWPTMSAFGPWFCSNIAREFNGLCPGSAVPCSALTCRSLCLDV